MILRRLSALPDGTLQALRVAAAVGSRFAVSELAFALGRPVAEQIDASGPALGARAHGRGPVPAETPPSTRTCGLACARSDSGVVGHQRLP